MIQHTDGVLRLLSTYTSACKANPHSVHPHFDWPRIDPVAHNKYSLFIPVIFVLTHLFALASPMSLQAPVTVAQRLFTFRVITRPLQYRSHSAGMLPHPVYINTTRPRHPGKKENQKGCQRQNVGSVRSEASVGVPQEMDFSSICRVHSRLYDESSVSLPFQPNMHCLGLCQRSVFPRQLVSVLCAESVPASHVRRE